MAERDRRRKSAPETARGREKRVLTGGLASDSGRRESRDPFADWETWVASIGWRPNPEVERWFSEWRDRWEPQIREWREKAERLETVKKLCERMIAFAEKGRRPSTVFLGVRGQRHRRGSR